MVKEF
jgi:hypothetical protein